MDSRQDWGYGNNALKPYPHVIVTILFMFFRLHCKNYSIFSCVMLMYRSQSK